MAGEQTLISILVVVAAISVVVLIVLGFMEIFTKPKKNETTDGQVISRQLKGFGLLQLAPILIMAVSVLGVMLRRGPQDVPAGILTAMAGK